MAKRRTVCGQPLRTNGSMKYRRDVRADGVNMPEVAVSRETVPSAPGGGAVLFVEGGSFAWLAGEVTRGSGGIGAASTGTATAPTYGCSGV